MPQISQVGRILWTFQLWESYLLKYSNSISQISHTRSFLRIFLLFSLLSAVSSSKTIFLSWNFYWRSLMYVLAQKYLANCKTYCPQNVKKLSIGSIQVLGYFLCVEGFYFRTNIEHMWDCNTVKIKSIEKLWKLKCVSESSRLDIKTA